MKKIELVFRSNEERTRDTALDFAIKNINPDKVHLIENIAPFSRAMEKVMEIQYEDDTEYVVFVDADCFIFEDLRPFLNKSNLPYVDCLVLDKFRGFVHMGVHITRIDVVRAMKEIKLPENDLKYILRPESRRRNLALQKLKESKSFKKFKILHDYCQYYNNIFIKYAIRELRSRTTFQRYKLEICLENWIYDDLDYLVARKAINHARNTIPLDVSTEIISEYLNMLPKIARAELDKMNIKEKKPLKIQEVLDLKAVINITCQFETKKGKIFCIGLSRTSTKSLTMALDMLGYNISHYPDDEDTFEELTTGTYNLSILEDYDGISDITVSPFYAQLDKNYPNSKFILTIRDKASWLQSLKKHWEDRPPFNDPRENQIHLKIRRFLRAAVYGIYAFNEERLSYVYDLHIKNVLEYFKNRPESLLIMNIVAGDGWEKLCPFLNKATINEPFPDVKLKDELVELL